ECVGEMKIFVIGVSKREVLEIGMSCNIFSSMNAHILHKFPCWRAAPSVLRDAQVSVIPVQLEFCTGAPRQTSLRDAQLLEGSSSLLDSTAHRAKPGCATRQCQR
ncbi:hypothetical protein A2U01_0059049, partial [Trifolium medium]|nr:hypothetical protein [Trifolium medium]